MRKYYFDNENDAKKAIEQENTRQAKTKTFYNIMVRKTKNNKFVVVIG